MPAAKFTNDQAKAALHEACGIIDHAARILNVKRETLKTRVLRTKRLMEIVQEERERALDLAESGLLRAVMADKAWAIRFLLSRLGKARGYGLKMEIQGDISVSDNMRIFEFPDDGREAKPDASGDN